MHPFRGVSWIWVCFFSRRKGSNSKVRWHRGTAGYESPIWICSELRLRILESQRARWFFVGGDGFFYKLLRGTGEAPGRFPYRQHFWFNRFKCKWAYGSTENFREQTGSDRLEQKSPFYLPYSVSAGSWSLEFFPPIPKFAGECCSRAVAVFLSISYRIVQNGICISL